MILNSLANSLTVLKNRFPTRLILIDFQSIKVPSLWK